MRGATILKASDDKTRVLNAHSLMAFSGEAGDTGMAPDDWEIVDAQSADAVGSTICRVHSGKHTAVLDA